ncbi:unnamed protein product [Caenorhabditis nigoni]
MNNPLLRDATDKELAKASPRELFQMAQEWPRDHVNIREMGLGLSDLYISENGKNGIKIIALVAKNFSDKSKFQVKNLRKDHPNAIHFYIRKKTEKNPRFGLMEIDGVGFDGIDDYDIDKYKLYVDDLNFGVITLLDELFLLFPEFLTRVFLGFSEIKFQEILEFLGSRLEFRLVREVSILKTMSIGAWSAVMENLVAVQKVTMGKYANLGDFENNHSIRHVAISNGSGLPVYKLVRLDYEILKIRDFDGDYLDILDIVDSWKSGGKPNLKFLRLGFKKTMKSHDLRELKQTLGGKKRRREHAIEKMVYRVDKTTYSLKNAMDLKTEDYSATYILTQKSFKFFVWKNSVIPENSSEKFSDEDPDSDDEESV